MSEKVYFTVLINSVEVFKADNDVQAFGFALSLHQTSNVSHLIEVLKDGYSIAQLELD